MTRAERLIAASRETATLNGDTSSAFFYSAFAGSLQAQITKLCKELAEYEPATGKGELETTYPTDGGDLVIHFDYEPGERETRDEPGCDPQVTINGVFANGMDITYLLDGTDTMEKIEEQCYQEIVERETDAAIWRAESSREEA